MSARRRRHARTRPVSDAPAGPVSDALVRLGGGDPVMFPRRPGGALLGRHERATHLVAGTSILLVAVVSGLAATAAATTSSWPILLVAPFGLLVAVGLGAIARMLAGTPPRDNRALATRLALALVAGSALGELASIGLLAGSIDTELDARAERAATATPAVIAATDDLTRLGAERTGLDDAVARARDYRDQALVVARCEYNPSVTCPETRITGDPGSGPETRTANERLAGAQIELDGALAARDRRGPELDQRIGAQRTAVDQARNAATAESDRGLGARWLALNAVTREQPDAAALRLFAIAFGTLLMALPMSWRIWRGESSHDRRIAAAETQERAELAADTAAVLADAQFRATTAALRAEQRLTAVTAIDAPAIDYPAIDDAEPRTVELPKLLSDRPRRIDPLRVDPFEIEDSMDPDMHLPIAAAAEAASRRAALPAVIPAEPAQLPEVAESAPVPARDVEPAARPNPFLPPVVDDVARAAGRWVRPLVPAALARAIDTTTHPLRSARQVFEEVEEITFSLKRTRKVTVRSDERPLPEPERPAPDTYQPSGYRSENYPAENYRLAENHRAEPAPRQPAGYPTPAVRPDPPLTYRDSVSTSPPAGTPRRPELTSSRRPETSWRLTGPDRTTELTEAERRRELPERSGPRELPRGAE